MPKWKIQLQFHIPNDARLTVEGAEYEDAHEAALVLGRKMAEEIHPDCRVTANLIQQIGEPWVLVSIYYSEGCLVLDRSLGNTFTEEDIALLLKRVENNTPASVDCHWNGAGCAHVSIRLKDGSLPPEGFDFTTALCGPRACVECNDMRLNKWETTPLPWRLCSAHYADAMSNARTKKMMERFEKHTGKKAFMEIQDGDG